MLQQEGGKMSVIFLRNWSTRSETMQETRNIVVINMAKNFAVTPSINRAPQFKVISDYRQMKFFQPADQSKRGRNSCPETSRATYRLVQMTDAF